MSKYKVGDNVIYFAPAKIHSLNTNVNAGEDPDITIKLSNGDIRDTVSSKIMLKKEFDNLTKMAVGADKAKERFVSFKDLLREKGLDEIGRPLNKEKDKKKTKRKSKSSSSPHSKKVKSPKTPRPITLDELRSGFSSSERTIEEQHESIRPQAQARSEAIDVPRKRNRSSSKGRLKKKKNLKRRRRRRNKF